MRSKKDWAPCSLMGEKTMPQLILRQAFADDANDIVRCMQDSETLEKMKYFSFFQGEITVGREKDYIGKMFISASDLLMAIIIPQKLMGVNYLIASIIGTIGLHEIDWQNNNARLGIIIFDKQYWGVGCGSSAVKIMLEFAFANLNLKKVYLTPRLDNELAIKIYEKFGFKREGILRQEYRIKEEQYLDLLRMSILREEWMEK